MSAAVFMLLFWLGFKRFEMPKPKLKPMLSYKPPRRR